MTIPTSWATMNAGADDGAMPAKVSDKVRATVTAGLAKLVDEVKKYAPPIHAPTANGTAAARPVRTQPLMTSSSLMVATTSESQSAGDDRTLVEASMAGSSNITLATTAPAQPPTT